MAKSSPKLAIAACLTAVVAMLLANVLLSQKHSGTTPVAQPLALVSLVTTQDDGSHRLCSSYANICFTYPHSWTQSKILHGSNFYGTSSPGGIELNPPSGIILTFTKSSSSTNTNCYGGSVCHVIISRVRPLAHGLYVLSATFESANETAGSDRYSPFIAIVSQSTLKGSGLGGAVNRTSVQVDSFNPVFSVAGGKPTELLVTGHGDSPTASVAWLNSAEAASAEALLATISIR